MGRKLAKCGMSFVMTLIISLSSVTVVTASAEISVNIDGERVIFPNGQSPVITDGRTLVPVRGVFEHMGFDGDWDADTETAIITSMEHELRVAIGMETFFANGASHTLDVPAQIIGGRTMLPIRSLLESVGYYLNWNGRTSTVIISSSPLPANVNRNISHTFEMKNRPLDRREDRFLCEAQEMVIKDSIIK